ncbi:MAG: hypothetical protein ACOZAM_30855 [Pseudomonadota bacterium]
MVALIWTFFWLESQAPGVTYTPPAPLAWAVLPLIYSAIIIVAWQMSYLIGRWLPYWLFLLVIGALLAGMIYFVQFVLLSHEASGFILQVSFAAIPVLAGWLAGAYPRATPFPLPLQS